MNNISPRDLVLDGFTDEFASKCRFRRTVLRGDPNKFSRDLDHFQIRDDDIWICSFMRSGSTWSKEMVWRITHDFSLENTELLRQRFPYFDLFIMNSCGARVQDYDHMLQRVNDMPSPRFLKTHLPFHLLPRQLRNGEKMVKMVYVVRNPKDVCVSLYYYYQHFYNFQGNLTDFSNLFITDKVLYAPYWDNVLSYWNRKKDMDILFLKYEAMKTDLPSVIRKTAEFFGKDAKDEQVAALSEHLSFENFQNNHTLNNDDIDADFARRFNLKTSRGFVRKGTVGQWKEEMSADMVSRFDDWIEKNIQNTDYAVDRCS